MGYDINKIPRLPYGEGSITIHNDELLIYKKVIKLPDATNRENWYMARLLKNVLKMRELEMELYQKSQRDQRSFFAILCIIGLFI